MGKAKGLGVDIHLPLKSGDIERRSSFSITPAENLMLQLLAEDEHTFASGLEAVPYGDGERKVCQAFIERGYGNTRMDMYID